MNIPTYLSQYITEDADVFNPIPVRPSNLQSLLCEAAGDLEHKIIAQVDQLARRLDQAARESRAAPLSQQLANSRPRQLETTYLGAKQKVDPRTLDAIDKTLGAIGSGLNYNLRFIGRTATRALGAIYGVNAVIGAVYAAATAALGEYAGHHPFYGMLLGYLIWGIIYQFWLGLKRAVNDMTEEERKFAEELEKELRE